MLLHLLAFAPHLSHLRHLRHCLRLVPLRWIQPGGPLIP
jgi:hypothetical protein